MQKLVTVAWRNLQRKPARAVLLAGSAAITAFLLFASYFFIHSMERSVTASGARLGADLLVVPRGFGAQAGEMIISGTATKFYMDERIAKQMAAIPEIEQVAPQLYLETVRTVCCKVTGDFPIVAFDPKRDFTLQAWMAQNRAFTQEDVLIGVEAGGANYIYHADDPTIQERVVLFDQTFTVRNLLFPTGMGADKTIFMHLAKARELLKREAKSLGIPDHAISILHVKAKPGMTEFVKWQMERMQLPVDIVKGSGLRDGLMAQLFPVKFLSYLMIVLMLVMSGLQVATMFSAIVSERRKEIGMLRAMGATKGKTYRLLLGEAALASAVGGGLGVTLSYAALYDNRVLLMQVVKLPLLFPEWQHGIVIGSTVILATVTIALLAAFFPVRSALAVEPYEAIREGE